MLGLALGLSWWATPQIVILALPALVWLVWRRPSVLRDWWIALPAALVGASPWIAWNARCIWNSLNPIEDRTGKLDHLRTLFTDVAPTALGLRVPFSLEWIAGPIVGLGPDRSRGCRPGLAGLATSTAPRGADPRLSRLRADPRALPVQLSSPSSRATLSLLQPVLALLIARAVYRPWPVAVGAVAAAVALSVAGLASMERHRLTVPRINETPTPENLTGLVRALERAQVKTAFADYWVAYPIDFLSRERIIATPAPDTGTIRNVLWDEAVRRSPNPAYVFVRGAGRESLARSRLLRARYHRIEVGEFSVYLRSGR